VRQRQPHHSNGLDEIPFQRAAPVVVAAVGNARLAAATADIVDQDVDAAIGSDSGLDQAGGVIGIANIGSVSCNFGAGRPQSRFRSPQLLGRARRQHDSATLDGKRFGSRQSDAAARTGNQDDLAAQFEIHGAAFLNASNQSTDRALRSAIQDFTWS
jgi:hypothetical protein